jgi:hypothetical protein
MVKPGFATQHRLQKLLGFICFIFQYRRELFSLQHHIYKYVQSMPNRRWVKLPGFVRDELRSMAFYMAFAVTDTRRSLHASLLATDPTPASGGSTRATAPAEVVEKLWHVSDARGEYVRLDETDLMRALSEWEVPREPLEMASILGRCLDWKTTSYYSFRESGHINLQEARALRRELKNFASDFNNGEKIQLALNDSRVVIGACGKDRSSSFKLNGILRGLLPHLVVGCGVLPWRGLRRGRILLTTYNRFRELPPPLSMPPGLKKMVDSGGRCRFGWEIFAGAGKLTAAHVALGVPIQCCLLLSWRIVWMLWVSWLKSVYGR